MNKRLFYIAIIVLGFVLVLAACGGQTTTTPPPVVPTKAPTQAPTAVPTVDPAEAIKPIFAASADMTASLWSAP